MNDDIYLEIFFHIDDISTLANLCLSHSGFYGVYKHYSNIICKNFIKTQSKFKKIFVKNNDQILSSLYSIDKSLRKSYINLAIVSYRLNYEYKYQQYNLLYDFLIENGLDYIEYFLHPSRLVMLAVEENYIEGLRFILKNYTLPTSIIKFALDNSTETLETFSISRILNDEYNWRIYNDL